MSKLQVDDIVNKEDNGSVGFSRGAVVTGVCTATSFSGPADTFTVETSGSERLRANSSGNVGINSTIPRSKLHVANGTSNFNTGNPTGLGAGAVASLESNTDVALQFLTSTSTDNFIYFGDTDSATTGSIQYDHNANALSFNVNGGTERLRIDSAGRVFIGTAATPSSGSVDDLIIAGSGNRGITINSTDSSETGIFFADGTSGSAQTEGQVVYVHSNNNMLFATSNSYKMRILSDGELQIYDTGSTSFNIANSNSAGTSNILIYGQHSSTNLANGTASFIVYTNGNVQNTNDSYGQISDIKLKENIVDAPSQWDDFKAVRFRKYNFKEETGHETHTQLGVIAQELELTSPGLVYEVAEKDEDGNPTGEITKAVKSSILTKKALVALQEAMARIESLEAKVAALESS